MPNLYQSLFWQTGSLTYVAPLIFASLFLGLLFRSVGQSNSKQYSLVTLAIGALLTFIAGGFSEMYVTMQTVMIVIALVWLYILNLRQKHPHLVSLLFAGLVGSIIAMIVIVIAPGNTVRLAAQPEPPGVIEIVLLSLRFGLHFIGKSVLLHPVPAAISVLIPFSLGAWKENRVLQGDMGNFDYDGRIKRIFLWIAPVAAYIIMVSAMMPSAYGISAYPPDRSLSVPQFGFTLIVMIWGYFAGVMIKGLAWYQRWNQRFVSTLLVVMIGILLVAGPLYLSYRIAKQIPSAQSFAAEWDERDKYVYSTIESGESEVVLATLGRIGDLPDIRESSDHWINKCFASYYGLVAVTSE
jgi:hypothetical protein